MVDMGYNAEISDIFHFFFFSTAKLTKIFQKILSEGNTL